MPSKSVDPRRRLLDILENIHFALEFVADADFEAFHNDRRNFYAVTRCLEIISEASRRLPDALKERHPHIPWRDMAGAGNIYRHDYEDVRISLVWGTVKERLPPLLAAVEAELARLP